MEPNLNEDEMRKLAMATMAVSRRAKEEGFSLKDPAKADYIAMLFQDALFDLGRKEQKPAAEPARPEPGLGDKPQA
jgi:hypothetical protein